MMGDGVVRIDLPEAGESLTNLLAWQNADVEYGPASDILLECKLRAGQQTYRDMWLADSSKPVSDRISKLCCEKLVLELGRPARDMMKTIVTH
jgi:hypothetical protein